MSFAELHKRVVYAVAGLGLWALSLGGEMSPVALVLMGLGFLASYFVEPPRVSSAFFLGPTYARAWVGGLLAFAAIQVLRWALLGTSPLLLLLELSAALSVSRLMNRRSAAEYQQIVLLSFLHLGAATVLTSDLSWAIPFVGFVLVMPWALALSHLRTEIEAHFSATRGDDDDHGLARILRSKRLISGRFLVGTAALSVPMFLVTVLFFVIFPRVGMNFLAAQREGATPLTGFGNEVHLGEVGTLRTDSTVIMRVVPPNLPPDPPRYAPLRLRGSSFDAYDGRTWSRTASAPHALRTLLRYHLILRSPSPGNDRGYRIVLSHLDPPVVFLPEGTVALEIDMTGRSATDELDLGMSGGLDIRYDDSEGLGLRYTAWTPPPGAREAVVGLTTADAQRYLAVPSGHEDVLSLAHTWTRGARNDRERAERILVALREGEFTYSLEMRDPGDRTPLSAFLFVHRAGHCEYFASAMAVMLRGEGIPARSVTGFLGGEWNSFGGYYAVRSSHAHAWVEAYLPGEGWVTFDPTPASRSPFPAASFFSGLDEIYDALAAEWEERVVSWDLSSQRGLFREMFRFFRRSGGGSPSPGTVEAELEATEEAAPSWTLDPLLIGLLVAFGVATWLLLRPRSTPDPLRGPRLLLAEIDGALAKRGRARPPSRTPLAHARQLRTEGFADHPEVQSLVDRYLSARFGSEPLADTELASLRGRARTLGQRERG